MRVIKFRAWDNINNKFRDIESINIARNNKPTSIVSNCDFYQIQSNSQIELMQYAGLKDKNGVEIYEGDIINVYDYDSIYEHKDKLTTKAKNVRFENGSFWFTNEVTKSFYSFSNYNRPGTSFEVIGNIHENPELLNNKEN